MCCATSKTAIENSKAWDTNHTAIHILMMYLKNSKVSVSCILFFCITILISSIQRTAVMISPAIGMITESLMLLIKANTSPFHPIGVFPTSVATAPTLSLMSRNMDSKFA